jgi:hypothetical protein
MPPSCFNVVRLVFRLVGKKTLPSGGSNVEMPSASSMENDMSFYAFTLNGDKDSAQIKMWESVSCT